MFTSVDAQILCGSTNKHAMSLPDAREAHKAKLAARKAAFVPFRVRKQAHIAELCAQNADKIAAQRAAFAKNHAAHLQKLATTRAGLLRVPPNSTPLDVLKMRNRGFANTVQLRIAALKRASQ